MDITQWLETQIAWSRKTFGAEPRLEGILKHIEKEIVEVRKDPTDVKEWIDIAILALDGAWRAEQGTRESQVPAEYLGGVVARALQAKSLENMFERSWPPPGAADQPVEHVREAFKQRLTTPEDVVPTPEGGEPTLLERVRRAAEGYQRPLVIVYGPWLSAYSLEAPSHWTLVSDNDMSRPGWNYRDFRHNGFDVVVCATDVHGYSVLAKRLNRISEEKEIEVKYV